MAQEMEIRVDSNKYEARISMLEGYVHQLEGLMGRYEALKNSVGNFMGEGIGYAKAMEAANTGIMRCRKAINATQANIASLQDILSNMTNLGSNIETVLEAAVEAASAGLFD